MLKLPGPLNLNRRKLSQGLGDGIWKEFVFQSLSVGTAIIDATAHFCWVPRDDGKAWYVLRWKISTSSQDAL